MRTIAHRFFYYNFININETPNIDDHDDANYLQHLSYFHIKNTKSLNITTVSYSMVLVIIILCDFRDFRTKNSNSYL